MASRLKEMEGGKDGWVVSLNRKTNSPKVGLKQETIKSLMCLLDILVVGLG